MKFIIRSLTALSILGLAHAAQAETVTLDPTKMIEAAFYKVRPGSEERLAKEYFPAALELAAKYGLVPLVSFQVTKVDHGPRGELSGWGLFQWPSIEAKKKFEKDRRFRKLRKLRDSLLVTKPIQLYTQVEESITVELDPEGYYEAAVIWANPERQANLGAYFERAGPFIAENDVDFVGKWKVIGMADDPEYAFDSLPSTFLFIDWGAAETKQKWFDSEAFAEVGHHRALALDRLFVVESRLKP